MFSFFFKHKSKNTQKVWDKNRKATKFSLKENATKHFFIYVDFVDPKWFLITTGSTRGKKLIYRFRFYFVCCYRFTIIFRIMQHNDMML